MNLLKNTHPILFKELDDNSQYSTDKLTTGSQKKMQWKGNCGHKWEATVKDRVKGGGCPYCSNKRVLIGYNDMWTTNPQLAKLLLNSEDGYRYTDGNKQKLDWQCPRCNEAIYQKITTNVKKHGLSCHFCSDKISFPERVMSNILRVWGIPFEKEKSFAWIKRRLYDFYLPDFNCIIEIHGKQHYSSSMHGKQTSSIQENDHLKKESAIKNNIQHYIEIDCSKEQFDLMKASFDNSQICKIIGKKIDWRTVMQNSVTDLTKCIWELHSKKHTPKQIAEIMKTSEWSVYQALSQGSLSSNILYDNKSNKTNNHSKVEIVQLTKDLKFVAYWSSLSDARTAVELSSTSSISKCLKDITSSAGGFKWMYAEDYISN